MDVSVIIVTYNTLQMTNECISSIVEKTKDVSYEIILVDNASTDGSREYFSQDERITYIYNETNYGFGKANNIGAACAKGKYLFFLNSDTLFLNDAITCFFDNAENSKEKVGFWGTVLIDRDGSPNGYGGLFPTIGDSLAQAAHLKKEKRIENACDVADLKVEYVLGADIFTPKIVFDELNGFDEDYFMYYEESDLQRRATKYGYGVRIILGPEIIHLEGKSSDTIPHGKRMMVETSHMTHLRKHYSAILFCSFLLVYILLKIPSFFLGHYTVKENIQYFKLLFKSF